MRSTGDWAKLIDASKLDLIGPPPGDEFLLETSNA